MLLLLFSGRFYLVLQLETIRWTQKRKNFKHSNMNIVNADHDDYTDNYHMLISKNREATIITFIL